MGSPPELACNIRLGRIAKYMPGSEPRGCDDRGCGCSGTWPGVQAGVTGGLGKRDRWSAWNSATAAMRSGRAG